MFKLLFSGMGKLFSSGIVVGLFKSWFFLGILAACLAIVLILGSYRGHVTPFGSRTGPLAERAADYVAASFPDYRESGLNPILVFPFAGPKGATMADLIRDALDATGRYDVIGKGRVEEILRTLKIDLPSLDPAAAKRYGANLSAAAVVTGVMSRVDETSSPPALVFSTVMSEVKGDRQWTLAFPPPGGVTPEAAAWRGDSALLVRAARIVGFALAFLLFSLATPFILYPLTRNLLGRDDNAVNAVMLAGYALLDAALLLVVLRPAPWLWTGVLIGFFAFIPALWLNYYSATLMERLRK